MFGTTVYIVVRHSRTLPSVSFLLNAVIGGRRWVLLDCFLYRGIEGVCSDWEEVGSQDGIIGMDSLSPTSCALSAMTLLLHLGTFVE